MTKTPQNSERRGFTLVELLTALTIFAITSTAVVAMIQAASQVHSTINASITNEWEVETALCRIIQNSRQCSILTVPTGVSGGGAFSLMTQPDAANGDQMYAVSYSLITASDGTKQLQENDVRYGNSILIHDVHSFDVRYKNIGSPVVIVVSLTAGENPGVTRVVEVRPRNM